MVRAEHISLCRRVHPFERLILVLEILGSNLDSGIGRSVVLVVRLSIPWQISGKYFKLFNGRFFPVISNPFLTNLLIILLF